MGLFTGLLTLPLAPVRATVWLAERMEEQAETELYDESSIRAGLMALDAEVRAGRLTEEEARQVEDALIERLMVLRGFQGDGDGTGH